MTICAIFYHQAAAICVGLVLCQVCTVVASSVDKNLTVILFVLLPKVLPNFIYKMAREKGFPKMTFVQKQKCQHLFY